MLALFALLASGVAAQGVVHVYLLAGQSNAEGHGEVATMNGTSGDYFNGTLAYQLRDPRTAALFAPLWDNSTQKWTVLSDVFIWFNENGTAAGDNGTAIPSAPGEASFGPLTVGFGATANPNFFGPELGLGFGLHAQMKGEKILLVKTAWGGKSLAGDFRPPSSVAAAAAGKDPFCQGACPNVVGHYYSTMVADLHAMLAPGAIAAQFPSLAGLTPVLSGIAWHQGWNDGCDLNQTAGYEQNLVNLIGDLRAEFESPALAFSIAASGFDGFNGAEATRFPHSDVPWIDMDPAAKIGTSCTIDRGCRRLDIVLSQLAAANATRHPDLGGHVAAAETRGFWRDAQFSPNHAEGYHWWHNAETHYLIGLALADGMQQAQAA